MIKSKTKACVALTCAALMLVAGCSGASDSQGTSESSSSGSSDADSATTTADGTGDKEAPAINTEHTLRIALPSDISTLNPWNTNSQTTDLSVLSEIYSSLATRAPNMEIKPQLATTWTQESPTRWIVDLREGIKYPNGEPFNASVVKWNFESILAPDSKARQKTNLVFIKSVEVVDEYKVAFETNGFAPYFPQAISSVYMLPPEWAKTHDPAKEVMGTGPYELVSWDHGAAITLKLKSPEDNWSGLGTYENVQYMIVPNVASQIAALQTGEVDVIQGFSSVQQESIAAIPDVKVTPVEDSKSMYLIMNQREAPFDNVSFRQALNYGVDKQAVIEALYGDLDLKPLASIATKFNAGHDASLEPYPYDPEKAKSLLAKAGYNGEEIVLEYGGDNYQLSPIVSQVIESQLKEIGVNVKLQSVTFSSWLAKLYEGELAGAAYMQIALTVLDAGILLHMFAPEQPFNFWPAEDLDAALNKADAATTEEARYSELAAAQQILYDQARFVFLVPVMNYFAVSTKIDWEPSPSSFIRAYDMKPAA